MNFHPFQGHQHLPDLPDAAHASREDLVAEMLGLPAHPLPAPRRLRCAPATGRRPTRTRPRSSS